MVHPAALRRAWAHPLVPAPVLGALGLAVGALAATAAVAATSSAPAPPIVLTAWVVLAVSAGYAVSGSV